MSGVVSSTLGENRVLKKEEVMGKACSTHGKTAMYIGF
jgi:hypothetical protein